MRKLAIFVFISMVTSLAAQNLDVTAYTQNISLVNSQNLTQEAQRQPAAYPTISETFEIPNF